MYTTNIMSGLIMMRIYDVMYNGIVLHIIAIIF